MVNLLEVTSGDNTIIGAGSLVTKSSPESNVNTAGELAHLNAYFMNLEGIKHPIHMEMVLLVRELRRCWKMSIKDLLRKFVRDGG